LQERCIYVPGAEHQSVELWLIDERIEVPAGALVDDERPQVWSRADDVPHSL
jgi:hypothetical protein